MRLLSQKEVKKAGDNQKDKGREIDKYISQKTKELNEFKLKHEKEKKEILEDYIKFAEDIAGQKTQLEGRFASLEARKGVAFKSLSDLSMKAEEKLEKAQKIESSFDLRERNLEARESKIKEERKSIDNREKMLNEKADKLHNESHRLDKYDNELQERANKITAELQARENKISDKEKVISERLEELNLGIDANNKVSDLLQARENRFEKFVAEKERELQDRRETLDRGFNELATKQNQRGQ